MNRVFLLLPLFLASTFTQASDNWPLGLAGDIKYGSSDFILQSANRNPTEVALDQNENGAYEKINQAYDRAKSGKWFIDYQRVGGDAIIAGIYKGDLGAIQRGLKVIQWGFHQQQADGSNTSGDAFHSTTFFLASAARAVLHLKNSKYSEQFKSDIETLIPAIGRTAAWLTRKEVEDPGLKGNDPYTHRFYVSAVAIGFSGVLLNRKDLSDHAFELAKVGVAKQNSDGSNPEKSGTDTGYHSLGLLMAGEYYSVVANPIQRASLKIMGEKAAAWIASKVLPNGDVDSKENTRTGSNGEMRHGTEAKPIMYFPIYKALAYWGQILDRSDFNSKAERIFKFDRKMKRNHGVGAG